MNRKTNVAPANDFVIAFNQSFGSGNTKKKYVESYLRKYPKKPKVTQEYERDYEKGWRNTIFELMGEALQQIYRFFLLPYKVRCASSQITIGRFCSPLYCHFSKCSKLSFQVELMIFHLSKVGIIWSLIRSV